MISYEPLKRLMKEKGINQSRLSEMTGINNTNLSNCLNYKVIARTDMIEKICKALNCDINDVICWEDGDYAKDKKVYIQWDKLTVSLRKLSLSLNCGCDYLLSKKIYNRTVFLSEAEIIAKLCNLDVKEIIYEIQ